MKYQALSKISLKSHPELTERWVQDRIAENPQMLGLGDVVLKDKERIQPRAGRLALHNSLPGENGRTTPALRCPRWPYRPPRPTRATPRRWSASGWMRCIWS